MNIGHRRHCAMAAAALGLVTATLAAGPGLEQGEAAAFTVAPAARSQTSLAALTADGKTYSDVANFTFEGAIHTALSTDTEVASCPVPVGVTVLASGNVTTTVHTVAQLRIILDVPRVGQFNLNPNRLGVALSTPTGAFAWVSARGVVSTARNSSGQVKGRLSASLVPDRASKTIRPGKGNAEVSGNWSCAAAVLPEYLPPELEAILTLQSWVTAALTNCGELDADLCSNDLKWLTTYLAEYAAYVDPNSLVNEDMEQMSEYIVNATLASLGGPANVALLQGYLNKLSDDNDAAQAASGP